LFFGPSGSLPLLHVFHRALNALPRHGAILATIWLPEILARSCYQQRDGTLTATPAAYDYGMQKRTNAQRPRRRAVRKNPTFGEATQMRYAMYDIDYMASEGTDVRDAFYRMQANPDEYPRMPSSERFALQQAIPTLLIVKLSAAVEDALDTLWHRRFPEVNTKSIRHDDKLRVMENLHEVDLSGVRELWALRNKCVHTVKTLATWDDYERHFDTIMKFVERFPTESKRTKRL
jgi:hypothetical protein